MATDGRTPPRPDGHEPLMEAVVEAPASSANLGPGFDSLGVALELRLRVILRLWPAGEAGLEAGCTTWPPCLRSLVVAGEGAGRLPAGPANRIWQAALRAFQAMGEQAGQELAGRVGLQRQGGWAVDIEAASAIPLASGLGSSAAAAVAGLWGANALFGTPLGYDRLLEEAAALEGHPDNAAPCALGGWVAAGLREGRVVAVRVPVPQGELAAVVVLPDMEMPTAEARARLPRSVGLEEAAFNVAGAALVVACLTTGRWSRLRSAMEDRLHQPARLPLVPGASRALERAVEAGAYGSCLSGAGPAVLALAPPWRAAEVGSAMQAAFGEAGLASRLWVLEPAEEGVRVRGERRPARAGGDG